MGALGGGAAMGTTLRGPFERQIPGQIGIVSMFPNLLQPVVNILERMKYRVHSALLNLAASPFADRAKERACDVPKSGDLWAGRKGPVDGVRASGLSSLEVERISGPFLLGPLL